MKIKLIGNKYRKGKLVPYKSRKDFSSEKDAFLHGYKSRGKNKIYNLDIKITSKKKKNSIDQAIKKGLKK